MLKQLGQVSERETTRRAWGCQKEASAAALARETDRRVGWASRPKGATLERGLMGQPESGHDVT